MVKFHEDAYIDKKLCHFFMVNQSSLLTLIFNEIAWDFFLLSKFKLLIKNCIKNTAQKVRIFFLLLAIIHDALKKKLAQFNFLQVYFKVGPHY